MVRAYRTTVLMRQTGFGFEWSVSCVGYFIGSLIYPVEHRLLPDDVSLNEGVLVTITNDRLLFEFVDSFPAPWSPP
jgi:hypothetical protein